MALRGWASGADPPALKSETTIVIETTETEQ
jgi:hypothetical protein